MEFWRAEENLSHMILRPQASTLGACPSIRFQVQIVIIKLTNEPIEVPPASISVITFAMPAMEN